MTDIRLSPYHHATPRARTRHGSVETSEKLLLVAERMAKLLYFAEPDLSLVAVYNIGRSFANASSPITTTTGIVTHAPGFTV
jgi:hypothetical protein